MTITPPTLKAGLVLLDPVTSNIARVIVMQYNPDTLTRTLQAQGDGRRRRATGRRCCGSRGRRSRR